MGTILHEGEYILISKRITVETQFIGYSVLSRIGVNTSKVNYIGSTKNFLTYAVIKDLELPFENLGWKEFTIKDTIFHPYHKTGRHLFLLHDDEDGLEYSSEIDAFIQSKVKEKTEKMTIEANNYIYIASNTTGLSDSQLISALFGYVPTCTECELIHGCALLWSRTKFLHERSFDVMDAKTRLYHLSVTLDFVRTTKGDIIIYKDVNDKAFKILKAYHEYRGNNDTEKEKENMSNNKFMLPPDVVTVSSDWRELDNVIFADNPAFGFRTTAQSVPDKLPDITLEDLRIESSVGTDLIIRGTLSVSPGVIRETRKYQFIQHAGSQLNGAAFLTARGTGKSVMIMKHMLNSIYGLNGGLSYKKSPLKFKLIFGQEHATGRYKTICLWEDGEKTIIHGDNKVTKLPVAQAFAWCYVKRTFGTVSHFKKHVDKRTTKMDGVWYFEGDCLLDEYAQGSVSGSSKKRDIYDAAALAIVTKRYGGLRKLVDEYINKDKEK